MKMRLSEIVPGTTVGMLNGVVKVDRVEGNSMYVSIGRLKGHRVTMKSPDEMVEVVNMPTNTAPWYGV